MDTETKSKKSDFKFVKDIVDQVAPMLPPPAGTVVTFISSALDWALDLIERGLNPITEIERIKAAGMKEVEESWEEELKRKD